MNLSPLAPLSFSSSNPPSRRSRELLAAGLDAVVATATVACVQALEHAQDLPRNPTPLPKPLSVHPSLVPLEPVAPADAKLPADGVTGHPATNGLRGWMRRTFSYP